jgi:hypothetical protein
LAYADAIQKSDWLDAATANEALQKLKRLQVNKIGYPDAIMNDGLLDLTYQAFTVSGIAISPAAQGHQHRRKGSLHNFTFKSNLVLVLFSTGDTSEWENAPEAALLPHLLIPTTNPQRHRPSWPTTSRS